MNFRKTASHALVAVTVMLGVSAAVVAKESAAAGALRSAWDLAGLGR